MNPKPQVLVVDPSLAHHSQLGECLPDSINLVSLLSIEQLEQYLASNDRPVDLLILSFDITAPPGAESRLAKWFPFHAAQRPGLVYSGANESYLEIKALELGALAYLTTPLQRDLVSARLRQALNIASQLKQLENQALTDALTNIPNRRYFDQILQNEWRWAQRNKSGLGVLMIDIDFFKSYNDQLGHPQGDDCIRAVANSLQSCIKRPHDALARYGGEEFSVVLSESDQQGLEVVANRILTTVNQMNLAHPGSPIADHITVSIGGAWTGADEQMNTKDLVEVADKALYQAKESGRNRYCYQSFTNWLPSIST